MIAFVFGLVCCVLMFRLLIYSRGSVKYFQICKTYWVIIHAIDKEFVKKNNGFEIEMMKAIRNPISFAFDIAYWKEEDVLDKKNKFYNDLIKFDSVDVINLGKALMLIPRSEETNNVNS